MSDKVPKEILTIRNKRMGKEYTVTDLDWADMEAKKNGSRVFDIIGRQKVQRDPVPRIRPSVPPEVEYSTEEVHKGNADRPEGSAIENAN